MDTLLKKLAPGYSPHGFRASFKSWCDEETGAENDVVEACSERSVRASKNKDASRTDQVIAQALSNRLIGSTTAEGAYRRGLKNLGPFFEKRRTLMGDWAAYVSKSATVVHLKRAG
jgi:hypothetical protein